MVFQDKRVVRRIRLGDKEALESLYQAHREDLYLLGYAMLRDGQLAEDVVHDVFVSFVRNVRTLKLQRSLKSYLATSAVNRARDILARRRFETPGIEHCPEPAAAENPAAEAETGELNSLLVRRLASLPPEQCEVILLRNRNNLSFRQIAEFLDIPMPTVQGRYRYGLAKLRSMFDGEKNP